MTKITPANGAAVPQPLPLSAPQGLQAPVRDAGALSNLQVALTQLGTVRRMPALPGDPHRLAAVVAALERERQRHPEEHPRDLLAALLEASNLRLRSTIPGAAAFAAAHADLRPEPRPSPATPRAPAVPSLAPMMEELVRSAARPGGPDTALSTVRQLRPFMPAELQAAWLAEWLSWPEPSAQDHEAAMALIHSGQLSDAARTNLLAKLTVRHLFAPSPTRLSSQHNV